MNSLKRSERLNKAPMFLSSEEAAQVSSLPISEDRTASGFSSGIDLLIREGQRDVKRSARRELHAEKLGYPQIFSETAVELG